MAGEESDKRDIKMKGQTKKKHQKTAPAHTIRKPLLPSPTSPIADFASLFDVSFEGKQLRQAAQRTAMLQEVVLQELPR